MDVKPRFAANVTVMMRCLMWPAIMEERHPGIKSQKATILEKSLDKIFRVAGGPPTRQPSSYNLLNGYFSKDDMSRLFCGNLSVAASDERRALAIKYLEIIFEYPRGAITTRNVEREVSRPDSNEG